MGDGLFDDDFLSSRRRNPKKNREQKKRETWQRVQNYLRSDIEKTQAKVEKNDTDSVDQFDGQPEEGERENNPIWEKRMVILKRRINVIHDQGLYKGMPEDDNDIEWLNRMESLTERLKKIRYKKFDTDEKM